MEESADVRESRRLLHRALTAFQVDADLPTARREFEAAFKLWRKVLDSHPEFGARRDCIHVGRCRAGVSAVLKQLDEPFPKDFVLQSCDRRAEHEF